MLENEENIKEHYFLQEKKKKINNNLKDKHFG